MSDQKFIPIEKAAESRFASSTDAELAHYLETLGLDPIEGEPQEKARGRVLAAMGLTDISGADRRRTSSAASVKHNGPVIRPPYNLTPNGLWGGRRRRIKIPRPDGVKAGQAEPISWNGKATYWLPYEKVESVPYPIYLILMDRRKRIVGRETVRSGDGAEEMRTTFSFSEYPMSDFGDDPLTADRAPSMTEWYRERGVKFFLARNTRELQSICGLLEISVTRGDIQKSAKSDEELRADIFTFLYGYPDVTDGDEEPETA